MGFRSCSRNFTMSVPVTNNIDVFENPRDMSVMVTTTFKNVIEENKKLKEALIGVNDFMKKKCDLLEQLEQAQVYNTAKRQEAEKIITSLRTQVRSLQQEKPQSSLENCDGYVQDDSITLEDQVNKEIVELLGGLPNQLNKPVPVTDVSQSPSTKSATVPSMNRPLTLTSATTVPNPHYDALPTAHNLLDFLNAPCHQDAEEVGLLKSQVVTLIKDVEQQQLKLHSLTDNNTAKAQMISELQQKIRMLEGNYSENLQQHHNDNAHAEVELSSLKEQIQQSNLMLQLESSAHSTCKDTVVRLTRDRDFLRDVQNKDRQRLDVLTAKLAASEEFLRHNSKQIDDLKTELGVERSKITEKEDSIADLQFKIEIHDKKYETEKRLKASLLMEKQEIEHQYQLLQIQHQELLDEHERFTELQLQMMRQKHNVASPNALTVHPRFPNPSPPKATQTTSTNPVVSPLPPMQPERLPEFNERCDPLMLSELPGIKVMCQEPCDSPMLSEHTGDKVIRPSLVPYGPPGVNPIFTGICPICKKTFPDETSLNIHANQCIDSNL